MKRVYSTSLQVAHLYANQSQSDARCHNTHFNGLAYYSYSTQIAQLHTRHGKNLLLIDSYSYSITTTKHIGDLRHAFSGDVKILRTPSVTPSLGDHEKNRDHFLKLVAEAVDKSTRARINKAAHIAYANLVIEDAHYYSGFFELNWELPATIYQAADALEKVQIARAAAREQQIAKKKIEQLEALENWTIGGNNLGFSYFNELRLRIAGDEIQTSQGARIPVAEAVRIWPVLKRLHDKKTDHIFEKGGQLGSYTVRHFLDNTLVVGCHNIPYSEIERMAVQLGLLETV